MASPIPLEAPVISAARLLMLGNLPNLQLTMTIRPTALLICLAVALPLTGCGDSSSQSGDKAAVEYPKPSGKSLAAVTKSYGKGPILAPSVALLGVGDNRFGFGLFTASHKLIDADSVALYVAPSSGGAASGPYEVRSESLAVKPEFESQITASDPDSAKSVYVANLPFKKNGKYRVVGLVNRGGKITATDPIEVEVQDLKNGPPQVGDRAIKVQTPTKADVSGDLSKIDTRVPPDTMHEVDFSEALGKKPIVLIFATPALCQSRVCGPVVDIAEQAKAKYGNKVDFIHMEIYKDNDPNKGFRSQVGAYRLPTEPWAFVINKDGEVVDRLEGAFSVSELEAAIKKTGVS